MQSILDTHRNIVADYSAFIRSFIHISDPKIRDVVEAELDKGKLWPDPLVQFNPSFRTQGAIEDHVKSGLLHAEMAQIFQPGQTLYEHQVRAIETGRREKDGDFIVTSGTGSGKSLTYIATIFRHILSSPGSTGVQAVVVYPMNALINSQTKEFEKYAEQYKARTGRDFPIRFAQYTGQEKEEKRKELRSNPPHILLTNYMMLELLLTRKNDDRHIRDSIYENLRYLVFDELHTYRGRQGADVALLIRRIRAKCHHDFRCIGTSATMVSDEGSSESRLVKVAEVASTLFGKTFTPDRIITERLTHSLDTGAVDISRHALAECIRIGITDSLGEESIKRHPVAVWLERRIALDERGGELLRGRPITRETIAQKLAEASGVDAGVTLGYLDALLLRLNAINKTILDSGRRYTLLPFKLHQFFSQTGTVYTTLARGTDRFITLEQGVSKALDDTARRVPLFPNVFSLTSGHAFVCVALDKEKCRLVPREFEVQNSFDHMEDGYLIIPEEGEALEDIWNQSEDLANLPDAWLNRAKDGKVTGIKGDKALRMPTRIGYDIAGGFDMRNPGRMPMQAWFMPRPLLFDPTSGSFTSEKASEGTKLTKLGKEGRSSSTTITALSILRRSAEAGVSPANNKLLSFTDNRQDAALQTGHFNDFVEVIRLRSAILRALENNGVGEGLDWQKMASALFSNLNLKFGDYARNEAAGDFAPAAQKINDLFRTHLTYRLVHDLRRGWRIIVPNLEATGLLRIDYAHLPEFAAWEKGWKDIPFLASAKPEARLEFYRQVLEFFRQNLAVHSNELFADGLLRENLRKFRDELRAPWYFESEDEAPAPVWIRTTKLSRKVSEQIDTVPVGVQSNLGKYIKHFAKQNGVLIGPGEYDHLRDTIFDALVAGNYLWRDEAVAEDNSRTWIYRLNLSVVRWHRGDGKAVYSGAPLVRRYEKSVSVELQRPNKYFGDLYRFDFLKLNKPLIAGDHTGQLGTEARIDREEKFREGVISALFCSPTMELGIDIRNLSIVHMRNAPPNPANYAQRSGRAGRGGQAALVFTYCSGYSAHDRHYFSKQADLVAGTVVAPRLDLCNRELLSTHLHALALSETGLSDLRNSVEDILDTDAGSDYPLSRKAKDDLALSDKAIADIRRIFDRVIADFREKLTARESWFNEDWTTLRLRGMDKALDDSINRWRTLRRSAEAILRKNTAELDKGVYKQNSDEFKAAKRAIDQAQRQIDLLRNDADGKNGEIAEFYPFRYLAAEGFLPGYNFTALPIRVFLEEGGQGQYVSRPRAVAIREFGPRNTIYHSGRKFEVRQIIYPEGNAPLTDAKVCTKSGIFLDGDRVNADVCPLTGADLADSNNRLVLHDLIEITESRAKPNDRITCAEEERFRKGFKMETFFSVDDFDRIRSARVLHGPDELIKMRFIPACRLVHVNSGWRERKEPGFPLAVQSGFWRDKMPDASAPAKNGQPEAKTEEVKGVLLYTTVTTDALYFEPTMALGLRKEGLITLQYAFKRAIEQIYQIEPSELGVTSIGDAEVPNILLYESAEGSLGILSRFVEDKDALAHVVKTAWDICRFDDPSYKEAASYDDLLSYYNQFNHKDIDRHLVRGALEKLRACSVQINTNRAFGDYDGHYQSLLKEIDPTSSTERKFLDHLYQNGLRLPDTAQKRVEGVYCQPDFFYEPDIWVFCDGTPHDDPVVKARDAEQRRAILNRGDQVIVYHYRDDLSALVAKRHDIFRKVK